jgi:cell wall-associated NlpC family hydrolase
MADLASYIGIPYRIGGRGPDAVDCAGLVMKFYREILGIELPSIFYGDEISREEMASIAEDGMASGQWAEIARPEYGDVLVFRMFGQPTHVGIYIGGDEFLHSVEGKDSCIERLSSWYARLVGVLRWKQA